jgi:hypothetical protein
VVLFGIVEVVGVFRGVRGVEVGGGRRAIGGGRNMI